MALPALMFLMTTTWAVGMGDVVGGRRPSTNSNAACRSFYTCGAGDEDVLHDSGKGCYCDHKCALYGDCCSNAVGLEQDWTNLQEIARASVCSKLPSRMTDYDLFLVSECPRPYADDSIRSMCEDLSLSGSDTLLRVPVTETENGFVFRNVYCAHCHGFVRENIMFWDVSYRCAPPGVLGEPTNVTRDEWELLNHRPLSEVLAMMGECNEDFSRPSSLVDPRGCIARLIDTCPEDWNDVEVAQRCVSEGTRVVSLQYDAYKNKFCAMCNDVPRGDCKNPLTQDAIDIIDSLPASIVPLSILLDFNSGTGTMDDRNVLTSDEGNCSPTQIYDVLSGICRDLSCDPGYRLEMYTCVSEESVGSANRSHSCAVLELADDEFAILDNGTLLLDATGTRVRSSRYFVNEDGSVSVCSDDYFRGRLTSGLNGKYDFDVAQGILSLVGTIISIIALIILLIVYGCIRQLRNIPGRCLMCLSASLCGAQLLFLIGMYTSEMKMICQAIGILTHLFFLMAFCWMSVMAFDIWRTFHQQFRLSSRSRKMTKFPMYCAYTVAVPLLIVALSIAFDHIEAPSVPSPDYGKNFCWINNKEALFYLFVLPVFLIIIANCMFFGISVYHIYHASSGASVLRKGRNEGAKRKRVILYAKLSTIMGLTWVFGFAAALTSSTILWYLFIIFNSLQGLFICIAFLCNRKVYRLVTSRAPRYSTSQTFTTSSGKTGSMVETGSYRKKANSDQPETRRLKQTNSFDR